MKKNFSMWLMLSVTAAIIVAAVVFTNTTDEPGTVSENNSETASATENGIHLHVPLSQCTILPEGSERSYFGAASGTVVNKTERVLRMDEWVKYLSLGMMNQAQLYMKAIALLMCIASNQGQLLLGKSMTHHFGILT